MVYATSSSHIEIYYRGTAFYYFFVTVKRMTYSQCIKECHKHIFQDFFLPFYFYIFYLFTEIECFNNFLYYFSHDGGRLLIKLNFKPHVSVFHWESGTDE